MVPQYIRKPVDIRKAKGGGKDGCYLRCSYHQGQGGVMRAFPRLLNRRFVSVGRP